MAETAYWQNGINSGNYIQTSDPGNLMAAISDSSSTNPYYIKVVAGSYLIDGPWLIPSNTTLDLYGCYIKQATNTNDKQLYNRNEARSITITNVTTTATATLTGHDYLKGQPIRIEGANEAAYNGWFFIASITDADTFVYTMSTDPGGSATGAVTCKGDRDITILGGTIDYDKPNNLGPVNPDEIHSVIFENVFNPNIQDTKIVNVFKFALVFANIAQMNAENITFDTTSDGLHIQGPAFGGSIRNIQGNTGDDIIAMTMGDWPSAQLSEGDIEGISITDVYPNESAIAGVKFGGKTGYKAKAISIKNIRGTTQSSMVQIVTDAFLPGTYIEDLSVENISSSVDFSDHFIQVSGDSIVERLTVNNVNVNILATGSAGANTLAYVAPGATIDKFFLLNIGVASTDYNGSGRCINQDGTINEIYVNNMRVKSIRGILDQSANANTGTVMYLSNVVFDDCNLVIRQRVNNLTAYMTNCQMINTNVAATGALWYIAAALTGGRLKGGCDVDANATTIIGVASSTMSVSGEFDVNQTSARLAPLSGDLINDQTHATPGRYEYTAAWAKL